MDGINLKVSKKISLLEKISPNIIITNIFQLFNNENKFVLPFLLSEINPEFLLKIEDSYKNSLINSNNNIKTSINILMVLRNFFSNCKKIYIEQHNNKNVDNINLEDPILDMFNKAEKETNDIKYSGLNYKKYFYNFLLNLPFINISPCGSIMNIIYWNEYFKLNNNQKINKQKIINVILFLQEEIAKCRINDLFGEIIFNQNNYYIKKNKIFFDCNLFMNVISNVYRFFNHPIKIIVNGGDKIIKHNFKKNEFIIDSILFKLVFKTNSLLIIYRV